MLASELPVYRETYRLVSLICRRFLYHQYIYEQAEYFAACMNSYFGMMTHFATYGIRRKAARHISPIWWRVCYISGHFEKISVKNKYKKNRILKKKLLKGINVWN